MMKFSKVLYCCVFSVLVRSSLEQDGQQSSENLHRIVRRQVERSQSNTGSDSTNVQSSSSSRASQTSAGSSSNTNPSRRRFVSSSGQPYYRHQPHVSTSGGGLGSGGTHSSSSSSSSSSLSSSSVGSSSQGSARASSRRGGSTSSSRSYRRRHPSVSVVDPTAGSRSQTYNYPFGRERIHYQYVGTQAGTGTPLGSSSNAGTVYRVVTTYEGTQNHPSSNGGGAVGSSGRTIGTSGGGSSSSSSSAGGRWRVVSSGDNGRRILANRRTRVDVSGRNPQRRRQTSSQTPSRRPGSSGNSNLSTLQGRRRPVSSVHGQPSGSSTGQTGIVYQNGVRPQQANVSSGQSGRRRQSVTSNRRRQSSTSGSGTRQQTVYSNPTNQRPGFTVTLQQVDSNTGGSHSQGGSAVQTGTHNTGGSQTYPQYYPQTSNDNAECPETGIDLRINGISCQQAVQQHGTYLCYAHEFTSRQCCEVCRPRRQSSRIGCEYGDHAPQCNSVVAADCYDMRTRQTCCASCERLRVSTGPPGCEYGDMTDQCNAVRHSPGLCYIPDNQRLCCNTCHSIRNHNNLNCPWGDYNSDLCQLFDQNSRNIRINCYSPHRRRICCQSCERLRQWVPDDVPGDCQYGDRPVVFNTDRFGQLNCTSLFQHFSANECQTNTAVATNCCFTCHRLRRAGRG